MTDQTGTDQICFLFCLFLKAKIKKTRQTILQASSCWLEHQFPMMPYCGCASDCLAAGVWRTLLAVALWGLVHVEWMLADGGLDSAVVLRCCWVWMWVRVWMWMGMWSCELSRNAVLGRGCKLGWWVSLGHGWIWGCRCVLVTLWGQRNSFCDLEGNFKALSLLTCCKPFLSILLVCFTKCPQSITIVGLT